MGTRPERRPSAVPSGTYVRDRDDHVRSSGIVTLTNAGWTTVDAALDCVVNAQVDDVLDIQASGLWQTATPNGQLRAVTLVSGAAVSIIGGTLGVPSWWAGNNSAVNSGDEKIAGSVPYKVVAGDIVGGQVTVRLQGKTGNPSRGISIDPTTFSLYFTVINTGPNLYSALGSAQLVFDGDSLTTGVGSTGGQNYPNQVLGLLAARVQAHHFGVSGQTALQMQADAATQIDAIRRTEWNNQVVLAWGGTNDIQVDFVNGTTAYDRLRTYCLARQAAGWKVVVFTILPRSAAGTVSNFETERQAANGLIRANWTTMANALADVAADPRIGDAGDETNTTYYADLVHLTNAGYAVVAAIAKTALGGLGVR